MTLLNWGRRIIWEHHVGERRYQVVLGPRHIRLVWRDRACSGMEPAHPIPTAAFGVIWI